MVEDLSYLYCFMLFFVVGNDKIRVGSILLNKRVEDWVQMIVVVDFDIQDNEMLLMFYDEEGDWENRFDCNFCEVCVGELLIRFWGIFVFI